LDRCGITLQKKRETDRYEPGNRTKTKDRACDIAKGWENCQQSAQTCQKPEAEDNLSKGAKQQAPQADA